MKKIISALLLALLVSGCGGVNVVREYGSPRYKPVPETRSVDERKASFSQHRIASIDKNCALVDGKYYGSAGMRDYFGKAKAPEARALWQQARRDSTKSALFPLIALAGGALLGSVGGAYYHSLQPRDENNYYDHYQNQQRSQGIGAASGLGLGLILGIMINRHYAGVSHQNRVRASESFNQLLLQRLDFEVKPQANGAAVRLNRQF
jgi:hypothetical protein